MGIYDKWNSDPLEGDSALNGRQGALENLGSSGIGHKSRVTLTNQIKEGLVVALCRHQRTR